MLGSPCTVVYSLSGEPLNSLKLYRAADCLSLSSFLFKVAFVTTKHQMFFFFPPGPDDCTDLIFAVFKHPLVLQLTNLELACFT